LEKPREPYATKLKYGLKAKMVKLSEKTRINQSKLMDEAIEDLLKKYDKQQKP